MNAAVTMRTKAAPETIAKTRRLGQPRLLIIGCGDVGGRILARVVGRFRVFALTTSTARAAQLRARGAVPIVADLDRPHAAHRLQALAPWIIDLAPTPASGQRDPRARRLAAALRGHPLRFVYASTTGVYGNAGGAQLDETARPQPHSERAMRRLDAERVLRGALAARVLRVPGIYAHDRLPLERLRQELPALIEADDVYTNHIHADDLARIAIAALFRGRSKRVYNAVDDSQMKMGEYFDLVADVHTLPRPPRLPRAQLRAAVTPAMYSFMEESRRFANRRIKQELRVRLQWPTVAAALRAHGPDTRFPVRPAKQSGAT
ncbi:MAG TPA: SDR family NAD(P)-dependent oxidoreductase [Burkholderiaceae bacterium]|nr:SDR family NAD(P)-dependent oxidoreductase [Burkholderiaceae bacterium]